MQGILSSIPGLAIAIGVAAAVPASRPWVWIAVAALAAYALVDILVKPSWRMRVHRWEVTDEAVYAAEGWWTHQWRIAPVSRIQTVDTVRGPLQRRYGLSSVTVTTASAAGPITIDCLDVPTARAVVAELTEITGHSAGDAT